MTTIVLVAFNTAWLSRWAIFTGSLIALQAVRRRENIGRSLGGTPYLHSLAFCVCVLLRSFKALLWACGRSALATRYLGPVQFAALMLAPLAPVSECEAAGKGRLGQAEAAAPPRRIVAAWAAKLSLMGAIAASLRHAESLPAPLRSFLYGAPPPAARRPPPAPRRRSGFSGCQQALYLSAPEPSMRLCQTSCLFPELSNCACRRRPGALLAAQPRHGRPRCRAERVGGRRG